MKLLLTFTYGVSLQDWYNNGLLSREVSLYKRLSDKGVHINFLTFGDKKDLIHTNSLGKIKVIPIKKFLSSNIPKLHFIKSLYLPLKLKNEFNGVDIIKTNQLSGSWISCIAKLLFRKKLIIRGGFEKLNRRILFYKEKGVVNTIKYFIQYILIFIYELIAYKLADGIIFSNLQDINFIIRVFKLKKKYKQKKIRHIFNHVNTDLFRPINCPKKNKHILFIGRLEWEKNLFMLLDAIKNLEEFTLDIIGSGTYLEKLKEKVSNQKIRVNFLERIPNNRLPAIINQYQIFIIPSFYEGNPKVLLEAMSCGLSCIGSNIQGINNIIKHRENGYLCELSPKSIQNAIKQVYENEPLRRQMGNKARKFAINNCSLKSIAQKEYVFYQEILKS